MARTLFRALASCILPLGLHAQTHERALNPISPPGLYIADPNARQMPDGRIYIYGSRDEPGNAWCSHSYDVLSSSDLVHWSVDQRSFATTDVGKQTDYTDNILYAPDCIHRGGRYYLFYSLAGTDTDSDEGIAVADDPAGPFRDGRPIVGAMGIDPSVFIDDDGQAYLFWGQGHARGARLGNDMHTLEGPIHDSLLTYEKDGFNEASSVRKRNGIYYYVYAGHQRHGASNCATLNYATARSPLGPYTFRGVIIDNFGSQDRLVNNHGCIANINGRWYVFYHRPTHGVSSMRKTCMEPIEFGPDGSIREVQMTTQGAGGPIDPLERMDAARACLLSGHVSVADRQPAYDIPVEYLRGARNGDWACWRYFDFTGKKARDFTCKISGENRAAQIDIRLDSINGPLIGFCMLVASKRETAYSIHHAAVRPVTGKHALYLVFKASDPEATNLALLDLEWFSFGRLTPR